MKTGCINGDCVDVAEKMINDGLNPAILNLASRRRPGGGYDRGMSAQEETLCRLSTLSQSLYQYYDPKYKSGYYADLKHGYCDVPTSLLNQEGKHRLKIKNIFC